VSAIPRDCKLAVEVTGPLRLDDCCVPLYAYHAPEATKVERKASEKFRTCMDDCNDAGMNELCRPLKEGLSARACPVEKWARVALLPTFHTEAQRAVRNA